MAVAKAGEGVNVSGGGLAPDGSLEGASEGGEELRGTQRTKLARRRATIRDSGTFKETIHDILVFFQGNFLCRLETVPEREARGPLAPVEAISGFVE